MADFSFSSQTIHQERGRSEVRNGSCTSIGVTQINLHRAKAASYTLAKTMEQKCSSIVLVQEPWTIGENICGRLPHTSLHIGVCNGLRPRAVIYTRGVRAWKLVTLSGRDLVAVQVKSPDGQDIVLASAYMAAEKPAPTQEVRDLVAFCEQRDLPLIIGSDCNSHNTVWGSTDTNPRGDDLFEFLIQSNITWLNRGTEPTFVTRARAEVLDITLVNSKALNLTSEWEVGREFSASDHRYIHFKVTKVAREVSHFRPVRRTDWNVFISELETFHVKNPPIRDILTPEDIEREAALLSEGIEDAFHKACPEVKTNTRQRAHWWTPDLDKLRAQAMSALNRARRVKTEASWEALRISRRRYNTALRSTKRQSWRLFVESLEGTHPLAKVMKSLKNDRTLQLSAVRDQQGMVTETPKQTLAVMLAHHVPGSVEPEDETGTSHYTRVECAPDPQTARQIITTELAAKAISAFMPYKSPGADGIYPITLQKTWQSPLGERYLNVFRASLTMGHIPAQWRKSKGVFIPKPGKTDYTQPSAYRMISLTSFQLKWLERMIWWHLEKDRVVQERISSRQFGFRSGMSTDTALHLLVRKIEKSMDEKEYALGIFLDIQNAFPTVNTSSIMEALSRHHVNPMIRRWIGATLEDRIITSSLGGESKTKRITRGCPQGGILSAFYWNAVMDGFLDSTKYMGGHVQAYADDLVGLFRGKDPPTLVDQANFFMKKASQWGRENGLIFSNSKTTAVVFTKNRSWAPKKGLSMDNHPITISKVAKYLGIVLDNKLAFRSHMDEKARKATASLAQVNRLVRKTWGINPAKSKWLYEAMIRPIITYGCVVWAHAAQSRSAMTKLQRVQRLACMQITSAYPSTPTAALEALLRIKPLEILIMETAVRTADRINLTGVWQKRRTNPHKGITNTHTDFCNNILKKIPLLSAPRDQVKRTWLPRKKYEMIIRERMDAIVSEQELREDTIKCFTDGSKSDTGQTGAGFVIYDGDSVTKENWYLGDTTTVFQAEVSAIERAASHLLRTNTAGKKVVFLVDSQAAIKALHQTRTISRIVLNGVTALNAIGTNNRVSLEWIPGHEGVAGNEDADSQAKEGGKLKVEGPGPFAPLPGPYIKNAIKRYSEEQHKIKWQSETRFRQSKEAFGWPKVTTCKKLASLGRKALRGALQILTGHGMLQRHRYISNKTQTAECPKCKETTETPNHFVGECVFYAARRKQLFGKETTSIREIVDSDNINLLVSFINQSGRLEDEFRPD